MSETSGRPGETYQVCSYDDWFENDFRTEKMLNDLRISRIVNCTHNISNFHEGKYKYYSFPIGKWRQHYMEENDTNRLWNFIQGYLTFLEESLFKGQ